MVELIGWGSSMILVLTIAIQLHKQWRSGTSRGVSSYLFVGQFMASSGFTLYSALIDSWVFTITNGLLALEALTGLAITQMHRLRGA
jgi:MtN3 and saliva related transmembrane protein